jgi:tetratricopeptide (TPR) repeat protein
LICKKCNTENQEGSLFCNKCGANIFDQNNNNREQREMSNKKLSFLKNKKTIIFISAVAIIVCSLLLFFYLNNPLRNYQNEIKSNNYSGASHIYDEKIKGNDEKEKQVKSFLLDEITEIENSFMDKKIEYSKATDRLETIKNTGLVSKDVKISIANIEKINNSRIAYKKAKEFQKEDNYIDAIREYKNVIKEDENYKSAQKQIKDMATNYKKDVLKQAEESAKSQDYDKSVSLLKEASSLIPENSDIIAKLAVYEKKLEEQKLVERKKKMEELKANQELVVISSKVVPDYFKINDQAQVVVKNNTQKVVKNFNVGIVMYDNNGYPLKSGTLAGESELFKGKAEAVNIQSGQTFGNNSAWNLYTDYGTVSKLNACVISVEYYDGSKWTNAYYSYWEEEYRGKPYN